MTRTRTAATAALLALALAACGDAATDGRVTAVHRHENDRCDITIAGDSEENTRDATHDTIPAAVCAEVEPGEGFEVEETEADGDGDAVSYEVEIDPEDLGVETDEDGDDDGD